MKVVVGIDVGGSSTKIVGFKNENGEQKLIRPFLVKATDPTTSIYGAFGKFTSENGLQLSDIERIMLTGVGSAQIGGSLYGLVGTKVPEFSCIGRGGLYLSGLKEAIIVSMGTGTALVHASDNGEIEYLGGTGVGGGTLSGLSKKMLNMNNINHIEALSREGDISKIDLQIKDISKNYSYKEMADDLTASNFGNISDLAENKDIALGIINMISETIAMMAIFNARNYKIKDIVLTGYLSTLPTVKKVFEGLEPKFDVNFIIPENSEFGTVIGAALCKE